MHGLGTWCGLRLEAKPRASLDASLKEMGRAHTRSTVNFGTTAGQMRQRVRLLRDSIIPRSASCLDDTILFARLLKAITLGQSSQNTLSSVGTPPISQMTGCFSKP